MLISNQERYNLPETVRYRPRAQKQPTSLAVAATSLYIFAMTDKKRTRALDWEDVRHFVALVRYRSLSSAARALRVNHATVSRRVARLEGMLGRPLFDHRADGYTLTADGKSVFDEANTMDGAALSLHHLFDASTELKGLVRITAGHTLAEWFLIDRMQELRRCHPAIDIELVGDARPLSLARREADIALRFGTPKSSDLTGRRVGTVFFGLYIAASLRNEPDAITQLPIIGFCKEDDWIAEAKWLESQFPGRRFAFRGSQATAQAAAARAGFGLALLPRYLAAGDTRLAEIACNMPLLEREVWLLVRPDLKRVPRVRAVADYLVELFRREWQHPTQSSDVRESLTRNERYD